LNYSDVQLCDDGRMVTTKPAPCKAPVTKVTISKFRQDLFKLADAALEGHPVQFTHKGVVFQLKPEKRRSRLSRLAGKPALAAGNTWKQAQEQLRKEMQAEWEKDWAEL
jgi:hypothetical protein